MLSFPIRFTRDQSRKLQRSCLTLASLWSMVLLLVLISTFTSTFPAQQRDVLAASAWASIGPERGDIRDLVIHPTEPNTLYAATSRGLYKSTDSGASWFRINSVSLISLAMNPLTPTTLYGGSVQSGFFKNASIYKSTNGGVTWSAVEQYQESIQDIVVDPVTPTIVYAARRYDGVYRSTNGGANWSAVNNGLTDTDAYALAIDPATPTTLYVGVWGSGVFKSTDRGANWRAINNGLTGAEIRALLVDPTTPSTLYAATADSGVFKSINGGANWFAANNGLIETDMASLAIDPATPAVLYAGAWSGDIYKTTDGGAAWNNVYIGGAKTIHAIAVRSAPAAAVYAAAAGDGVLKSSDGGAAWNKIKNGLTDTCVTALAIGGSSPATL